MHPNFLFVIAALWAGVAGAQAPANTQAPPPPPPPDATVPNFDAVFEPMMSANRPPSGTQQQQQQQQQAAGALPPQPKAEAVDLKELERTLGTWRGVEETLRQQEHPKALVSRTVSVSLSPGAGSPSVQIPHNYVVVLEFLDNAGAPWPIRKVLSGSKEAFQVEQGVTDQPAASVAVAAPAPAPATPTAPAPQVFGRSPAKPDLDAGQPEVAMAAPPDGSNILLISALSPYAASNVAILMQGSSTPISIALHAVEPSAKESYTDRYTLLLDGFGPYAPPLRSTGPADTLSDVVAVLANQPPAGAALVAAQWPGKPSATMTGAPRIWRKGSTLWLRTQDTLLSPAPTAKVSRGEWTAYRLNYLPLLLLSREGQTYQVQVR